MSFYANTVRWLSVYGGYGKGTGINYTPADGLDPFRANSTDANLGFTLRPSPSLTFTQYYYYSRLGSRANTLPVGERPGSLFNNHLLRWKVNYQFSKAFSLRTIVDYYGLLPNPSLFNSDKYKQLTGDILFTYLINPGTALYIGYNNRYENVLLDPSIPPGLRRIAAINDLTSRQFFIKLSYLLRF
jgi:hypothetical protein